MEVIFEIEYRTEWGQRLVWCSGERRIAMEYRSDGVWRCRTTLAAGDVEYGYEVEADGRTIRREWRPHRQVIPQRGAERMSVCDRWSDRPTDAPFYTSAFTRAIFARPADGKPFDEGHGRLELQVEAPTVRPDEVLAIAGNAPELGGWQRFVALDDSDFPLWRVVLDAATPFEYKFVRLDRRSRRPIVWEEGENRRCDRLPAAGERIVVAGLRLREANASAWRGAGTALPLFSLRSASGFGTGEFPDLRKLIDWAAATGQRVVQLLPVNDTIRTGTRSDSYPYNAVSSFALHPLYLSLIGAGLQPDARYRRQQRRLNALPTVDYEAVMRLKLDWARLLFRRTWETVRTTDGYAAFETQNRLWLEPYAAFSALRDRFGTADFRQWGEYARYDEQRLRVFRNENRAAIDFYCFLQYHLHSQLSDASRYARQRGVVLKGDIPIGVSPSSADVWQYPHLFHLDGQAGAPPDAFAATGQNWGFPTYDWEHMAQDGYAWWQARMAKMAEYFDAFRIDHILGFFRIWEIPVHAVHGLLGYFNPALPYSADELRGMGFDTAGGRFTVPAPDDRMLGELFGELADEVRTTCMKEGRLLPAYATQRKVAERFPGDDPRRSRLREGLMTLLDDVLFIEDPRRKGFFHPRIAAQSTYMYRTLDPQRRDTFDRLHDDFFYRRHNRFWQESALRKLPVLLSATRMLACGEDLGMIPDSVPETMRALQILSLEIQRMPKSLGEMFADPARYPYFSVCTTSTHDMNPLRAWWEENRELSERFYREVLGMEGDAPRTCEPWICRRIVDMHLRSPAMLAILPLQDWLATDAALRSPHADRERINIPAAPRYYWRYRMHLTLEELLRQEPFNATLREMIIAGGRR